MLLSVQLVSVVTSSVAPLLSLPLSIIAIERVL